MLNKNVTARISSLLLGTYDSRWIRNGVTSRHRLLEPSGSEVAVAFHEPSDIVIDYQSLTEIVRASHTATARLNKFLHRDIGAVCLVFLASSRRDLIPRVQECKFSDDLIAALIIRKIVSGGDGWTD